MSIQQHYHIVGEPHGAEHLVVARSEATVCGVAIDPRWPLARGIFTLDSLKGNASVCAKCWEVAAEGTKHLEKRVYVLVNPHSYDEPRVIAQPSPQSVMQMIEAEVRGGAYILDVSEQEWDHYNRAKQTYEIARQALATAKKVTIEWQPIIVFRNQNS